MCVVVWEGMVRYGRMCGEVLKDVVRYGTIESDQRDSSVLYSLQT